MPTREVATQTRLQSGSSKLRTLVATRGGDCETLHEPQSVGMRLLMMDTSVPVLEDGTRRSSYGEVKRFATRLRYSRAAELHFQTNQ